MSFKFFTLAIYIVFIIYSLNATAQIKILPLGNSITHAKEGQNSYRRNLWVLLIEANYDIDFVGTQNRTYDGTSFPDPNFDHDHEGHSGWRADEIMHELPGWLNEYTPDIALIHLGSNDVRDKQSASSTVYEIDSIIDILRNDNAEIAIFLAQIIPGGWLDPTGDKVPELNQALAKLASSKTTKQSPVIIVDHYEGWKSWAHTYDGVHPNILGESRMARMWFDAIDNYLSSERYKQ